MTNTSDSTSAPKSASSGSGTTATLEDPIAAEVLPRRAATPGIPISHPLMHMLPAIYHGDDFSARWLRGFDEVLAPIPSTLDCFSAYLDPALAPEDVLRWLGSWVGADDLDDIPLPRRRSLVASVVALYAMRGTPQGLRELMELTLPVSCDVIEGGGCVASSIPSGPLPGTDAAAFVVRIVENQPLTEDQKRRASLLVEANRPAHLPAVVEFSST
jgi:phage tail-like protein